MSVSAQVADELLIHKLGCGETIVQAAGAARVSPSTVYRRLRDPEFRARVDEVRTAAVDTLRNQLVASGSAARDALLALLKSTSESIQLRAARILIELAFKFHKRDDVVDSSVPGEDCTFASNPRTAEIADLFPASDPVAPSPTASPEPSTQQTAVVTGGKSDTGQQAEPALSVPPMSQNGSRIASQELSKRVISCHEPETTPV